MPATVSYLVSMLTIVEFGLSVLAAAALGVVFYAAGAWTWSRAHEENSAHITAATIL